TIDSLMEAIRAGRFYASTGVTIQGMRREGETWTIESEDADRIRFIGSDGKLLALADAASGVYMFKQAGAIGTEPLMPSEIGLAARYRFTGDEGYVRCELVGRGGRMAWTQPVWVGP
ncbi:MAG: hypothetical protein KY468_18995, partial [Armatimonadetes bacterium]|nr:hypothetical protein [Armatimonadota bacterium]